MQTLPHTLIISPEISLEKVSSQHAPALFAQIDRHREYLNQYVQWARFTQSPKDTQDFLQRCEQGIAEGKTFVWTIFYQQQAVGTISFNAPIDWQNRTVYFGYWLSPEAQGKGIVSQAIEVLIQATKQNFDHYILKCAVHNHKSNNVAKRCGFQFEQCLPQAEQIGEQWFDQNVYRRNIK